MDKNIDLHNQSKNLNIDFLKSLLNDNSFDKLILDGEFKEININNYGSISFDENGQAILSKELFFKLYGVKAKKWSDTNLDFTDNGKLYLNKNYNKFKKQILSVTYNKKEEIKRSKEYNTAMLLDSIYSELTGLSYGVDKNKQKTIDDKITELEEKSIEYSNVFQLKITILRNILNDFKGITGKELDKVGAIDFKHNFNVFANDLEKPFKQIKTDNISVVLSNKFSKNNKENNNIDIKDLYVDFKKDLILKLENVLKNNTKTKIIFFDYQFEDEFLDELGVIIKKYSREDIKVIFSAGNDMQSNRKITNIGGLYASTLVGINTNFQKDIAKASYDTFIDSDIKTKGIVTKYLSISKELMTVSNTINIIANPRNLLKNIPRKYDKVNKTYYNNYKNIENDLNTFRDIDNSEIPDTRIILFGAEQNGNRGSELDVFTRRKSGKVIAGTEVLANTILNNDLNNI